MALGLKSRIWWWKWRWNGNTWTITYGCFIDSGVSTSMHLSHSAKWTCHHSWQTEHIVRNEHEWTCFWTAPACGHISQIGDIIIITGVMYMLTTNSYQVLSVAQSARGWSKCKRNNDFKCSGQVLGVCSKTNSTEQFRKAPWCSLLHCADSMAELSTLIHPWNQWWCSLFTSVTYYPSAWINTVFRSPELSMCFSWPWSSYGFAIFWCFISQWHQRLMKVQSWSLNS